MHSTSSIVMFAPYPGALQSYIIKRLEKFRKIRFLKFQTFKIHGVISGYWYKKNALFCFITQRVVVIFQRRFAFIFRVKGLKNLNPEDGTDGLSRNVAKKLPLFAA